MYEYAAGQRREQTWNITRLVSLSRVSTRLYFPPTTPQLAHPQIRDQSFTREPSNFLRPNPFPRAPSARRYRDVGNIQSLMFPGLNSLPPPSPTADPSFHRSRWVYDTASSASATIHGDASPQKRAAGEVRTDQGRPMNYGSAPVRLRPAGEADVTVQHDGYWRREWVDLANLGSATDRCCGVIGSSHRAG